MANNIFYFVKKRGLQKHLNDLLMTVGELSSIASTYPEPIKSVLYRTSIVYLASIIEAVLHDCMIQLSGIYFYQSNWMYKEFKLVHEINEDIQIGGVRREKKKSKVNGYIDFKDLNKYCHKELKLYNKKLYDDIDEVRDLRNNIHLMKVTMKERKVSKNKVNDVSAVLDEVLDIVEGKVKI